MDDHMSSFQQHPTQKFWKNYKNPKNFPNDENLGQKIHECTKKRKMKRSRTLTKWGRLGLSWKDDGWSDI